jgi:hypothetical protein
VDATCWPWRRRGAPCMSSSTWGLRRR